ITSALQRFNTVIPVKSIENAVNIAGGLDATLAGEREGAKIEGFDVGNSPVDILKFSGEVLVLTTTNGTRVLEGMNAKVLIGSFTNAEAVAIKAIELADQHIELVMAGVKGRFVIEDFLSAGEILSHIIHLKYHEMDEMALAALMASLDKDMVDNAVRGSESAARLRGLELEGDIEFSLQRDIYNTVPIYKNGVIKILK
ncbi:MAG: 2-phosphosulfolactate phosphatase, partial [Methanobacterium sp.]